MKKTLAFIMALFLTACNFEKPRKNNEPSEDLYYIICKHPRKNYVQFKVTKNTWKSPYSLRNSIWIFKDIQGRIVKTSLGCYTDNTLIKRKQ